MSQRILSACVQMVVEGEIIQRKNEKVAKYRNSKVHEQIPNSENQILAKSSLQPRSLLGPVTTLTTDDEGNVIKSVGMYKAPEALADVTSIRSMPQGALTVSFTPVL